ncbi:MAG TPA: hypothetical protein VKK31_02385 [Thermoanaerobaculia bacterium]|nr:hypothetical protein [Thermoanaerobaculia bacterium]
MQGKEPFITQKTPWISRSILPILALTVGLVTSAQAGAVTSRVAPVLYMPAGATQYAGPEGEALLDYHASGVSRGLANVARWYARELPNDLALWDDLIVFRGNYTAAQCLADMGPCIGDTATSLGLDPWAPGNVRQKLLIVGAGFLGWAGGTGNTAGQGYAVVGMESLMDTPKCAGNWWCTPEIWHGTVAHELGHTFSLPHSSDPNSIMNFHGDWINKHFTGSEPATVQSDPATEPKRTNWSYCEIDFECASLRCGGNVSEPRLLCLPSALYSKGAANIPDGVFCRTNAQCQSGACGIGPEGDRICLRYPAMFFPEGAP